MKLSEWEIRLLLAVQSDRDEFAGMKLEWHPGGDRQESAKLTRRVTDARTGIVRIDLTRWLGRAPTASDRTQGCRAIRRLIERGLLIGHGYERTKLVELTADGEAVARAIPKDGAA